jgi:hypothetical protein
MTNEEKKGFSKLLKLKVLIRFCKISDDVLRG